MGLSTIQVSGMSCGHCVKTVSAALAAVPGLTIRAVAVGQAEVDAPTPEHLRRALAAIDGAGFEASVPSGGGGGGGGGCGCGSSSCRKS
jgi:copper chaperone CopZ